MEGSPSLYQYLLQDVQGPNIFYMRLLLFAYEISKSGTDNYYNDLYLYSTFYAENAAQSASQDD